MRSSVASITRAPRTHRRIVRDGCQPIASPSRSHFNGRHHALSLLGTDTGADTGRAGFAGCQKRVLVLHGTVTFPCHPNEAKNRDTFHCGSIKSPRRHQLAAEHRLASRISQYMLLRGFWAKSSAVLSSFAFTRTSWIWHAIVCRGSPAVLLCK